MNKDPISDWYYFMSHSSYGSDHYLASVCASSIVFTNKMFGFAVGLYFSAEPCKGAGPKLNLLSYGKILVKAKGNVTPRINYRTKYFLLGQLPLCKNHSSALISCSKRLALTCSNVSSLLQEDLLSKNTKIQSFIKPYVAVHLLSLKKLFLLI